MAEMRRSEMIVTQPGLFKVCRWPEGCDKPTVSGGLCKPHWEKTWYAKRGKARDTPLFTPALTAEECAAIRRGHRQQFKSQRTLSQEFNVTTKVIARVIAGTYTPRPTGTATTEEASHEG